MQTLGVRFTLPLARDSPSDDVAGSASDNAATAMCLADETRENYSGGSSGQKRQRRGRGGRPRAPLHSINLRSPAHCPLRRARSSEINRFDARVPLEDREVRSKTAAAVIDAASPKNDNRLHASLMSSSSTFTLYATDDDDAGRGRVDRGADVDCRELRAQIDLAQGPLENLGRDAFR